MESVNIAEASSLLEISRQRVQQLIWAKRVKGAYNSYLAPLPKSSDTPILRG